LGLHSFIHCVHSLGMYIRVQQRVTKAFYENKLARWTYNEDCSTFYHLYIYAILPIYQQNVYLWTHYMYIHEHTVCIYMYLVRFKCTHSYIHTYAYINNSCILFQVRNYCYIFINPPLSKVSFEHVKQPKLVEKWLVNYIAHYLLLCCLWTTNMF
jgi:hypothetical protein